MGMCFSLMKDCSDDYHDSKQISSNFNANDTTLMDKFRQQLAQQHSPCSLEFY